MSTQTPTIQEINENIISQLELAIGKTIPILPKSFSRILAKILSGVFVIGYKFAGWIMLQMFVTTAEFDSVTVNGKTFSPLIEWGKLIGVGTPTPATRAELDVDVFVDPATGSLPAGTLLLKDTTGVVYAVVSSIALDAATVTARIQAVDDDQGNLGFGAIGNLSIGDSLSFANPVANVSRDVTVSAVAIVAGDGETEQEYRERVAQRFTRRPQGGALVDYQIWGEGVAGINLVMPYTGNPNQIILFSRATEASSGNEDGIPTAEQLTAVKDACLFDEDGRATRAPPGVDIQSLAHSRLVVDTEILGLTTSGDLASLKASLDEAMDAHLRSLEPFILGVSALPAADRVSSAALGGVVYTVTNAAGATFTTFTMTLGGVPTDTHVLQQGELAKLGASTY